MFTVGSTVSRSSWTTHEHGTVDLVNIDLTDDDVEYVLGLLGYRPYIESAPLIEKIKEAKERSDGV